MPRNEGKYKIKTVYNISLKIQYLLILNTPEYGRQKQYSDISKT